MATETQERVEPDIEDADNTEWATKADVQKVESKVDRLAAQVQSMMVEIGKLQVGQKWIAWILGVMCAALFAIFATLVIIAMQL